VEEFKNCVSNEVKTYLDEHKAETLQQAAVLADEYTLTHKRVFPPKSENADQRTRSLAGQLFPTRNSSPYNLKSNDTGDANKKRIKPFSGSTCHYCKWKGHIMSKCWALEKKEKTKKSDMIVTKPGVLNKCPVVEKTSEENDFKPFISECKLSLVGMNKLNSIKMLRDTGASQSLLVQSALPLDEQAFTGSNILIQGIKSDVTSVPLHVIDLQSSLVSGPVMVGIVTSLPVPGVSLILGMT